MYLYNIKFSVGDDYQTLVHQISGGVFSSEPGMNYLFLAYVGYSYLITILFSFIDTVNWVAVFEVSLLILSILIYLKKILDLSESINKNTWWILICLIASSISFLDAFAIISYTRPALLLCGLSLYTLLFTECNKRQKIFYHLIFIMGMLFRPESGLGMLLYVGAAYLIFNLDVKGFLENTKWIIAFIVGYMCYSWYLINYVDNFLYNIEPEIEYNFIQDYVKKLPSNTSQQDSIKYMVATNGFIFDPDVLTADYLREIQENPSFQVIVNNSDEAIKKVLKYCTFNSISIAVLFITILILLYTKNYLLLFKVFLLTLTTFALFVLLNISSGVGNRHIQPFLAIYQLLLFKFIAYSLFKNKSLNPLVWSLSLILLFISIQYYISNTVQKSNELVQKCLRSENRKQYLEENYKGELIVGTISSMTDVFNQRYTFLNKRNFNNKYMVFEFYNFSMHPPYDKYIKKQLGKEHYNVKDVYQYFCENNAIYLASKKKTLLTEDYLKIIYDFKVDFTLESFQYIDSENTTLVTRLNCKE